LLFYLLNSNLSRRNACLTFYDYSDKFGILALYRSTLSINRRGDSEIIIQALFSSSKGGSMPPEQRDASIKEH